MSRYARVLSPGLALVVVTIGISLSGGAIATAADFFTAGSATVVPGGLPLAPGASSNYMRIVPDGVNDQNGSVGFAQVPSNTGAYDSLQFEFDFRMDDPVTGADGLSFFYMNTAVNGTTGTAPLLAEEPNLAGAIGIGFDSWNNDDATDGTDVGLGGVDGSLPNSFSLHFDGARLQSLSLLNPMFATSGAGGTPLPADWLENGQTKHALIVMDRNPGGGVDVSLAVLEYSSGIAVTPFLGVNIPTATTYDGRIGFASRTGNENQNAEVDNITTNFTPTGGAAVSTVVQDFEGTQPPLLPDEPLPGPAGGNGTWGIREVRALGGSGGIAAAYNKIASGGGTIFDGSAAVINHNDPKTNGAGSGRFTPDAPFLSNGFADSGAGQGENDIQMVAHGRVAIPAAGQWTFGTHSDDGFALRVRDSAGNLVAWDSVSGAGSLDALGGKNNLAHPAPTGDSNTRGVITLQQGVYDLEYIAYEDGGGAYWELYAAQGAHVNDADTDRWRLVGHKAGAPTVKPGIGPNGWVVAQDPNGPAGSLTNFAQANAAIDAALADGSAIIVENVPSINYIDPQSGATHSFGGDIPFPGNSGADDDDFGIRGQAELVILADGNYRFGFRGDDGGYIRITGGQDGNGGNFSTIVTNATGLSTIQENGDLLICDCLTGDSNTLAETFLAAGTYAIETGFFERGGGASYEVFGSGPGTSLMLLMTGGAILTPDFDGLQLVPEPSTYVLVMIAVFGGMLIRRRRK